RAQTGVAGHDQYGGIGSATNQFCAGLARQTQVADDQREVVQIVVLDGFMYSASLTDLVLVAFQQPPQCGANDGFVFNNQNMRHIYLYATAPDEVRRCRN